MADRLNTTVEAVAQQEHEDRDLSLSALYQWQAALNIPLSELLCDPTESLAPTVKQRAQMVRVMKTAKFILEQAAGNQRLCRTARMLIDQLVEVMPELREVLPWNEVGRRHTSEDVGGAYYRGTGFEAVLREWSRDM